jgi:hypothetical protein
MKGCIRDINSYTKPYQEKPGNLLKKFFSTYYATKRDKYHTQTILTIYTFDDIKSLYLERRKELVKELTKRPLDSSQSSDWEQTVRIQTDYGSDDDSSIWV